MGNAFLCFLLAGGLPAALFQFVVFSNEPNCVEFVVVLFWLTIGLALAFTSDDGPSEGR